MKKAQGKFIVFEGLDGSGKSTQAKKFEDHLRGLGVELLVTHEPTEESEAGKKIRRILQHQEPFPATPEEFQLLYIEDRRSHVENVILPALEAGLTVIGDRYYLSTVAFGSIGGCDIEWLHEINAEFPAPDLTLIIDTAPGICLERIGKRGEGLEYFERQAKFGRAQDTYRLMPTRHKNVHLVNGEETPDIVWQNVWRHASPHFV